MKTESSKKSVGGKPKRAKKQTKTSTKSSSEAPSTSDVGQKIASVVQQDFTDKERAATVPAFNPYTGEGWEFLSTYSIKCAYPPIQYIGDRVFLQIARILGRPLTLIEAQYLVQPDGEMVSCASEGVVFQPVKYVAYVPPTLEPHIREGGFITNAVLPFGGCYYSDTRGDGKIALSGSVYRYNPGTSRYEHCKSSPLFLMHQMILEQRKVRQWGMPLDEVSRMQEQIREKEENRQRAIKENTARWQRVRKLSQGVAVRQGKWTGPNGDEAFRDARRRKGRG